MSHDEPCFGKNFGSLEFTPTALVASCLGVILFFEAIEWFGPFLDTFQQLQVGIAQVTPMTCDAINRSSDFFYRT